MIHKYRNIILNILALFIGIFIFLIIGEITLRILYPKGIPEVYPAIFMDDVDTGYGLKPNYSATHIHRDFTMTYTTNSSGFRDYDFPMAKQDNIYRILVLGDSMTFGVGVPLDSTYSKILEKKLNQDNHRIRYEVINTGVPGYSTDNEYNFYTKKGFLWNPDMVILGFFGQNDIDGVERGWQNVSVNKGYLEKNQAQGDPNKHILKGYLVTRSKLALFFYYNLTKLMEAKKRQGKPRELPFQIYHDSYTDSFKQAIDSTKSYINELNKQCTSNNIRFLLILIPFEMEVNKKNWIKYQLEDSYTDKVFNQNLLQPSKLFQRFGNDNNIPTLDLVPVFRNDNPDQCYFRWEAHWNSRGHGLAADAIYNYSTAYHWLENIKTDNSPHIKLTNKAK